MKNRSEHPGGGGSLIWIGLAASGVLLALWGAASWEAPCSFQICSPAINQPSRPPVGRTPSPPPGERDGVRGLGSKADVPEADPAAIPSVPAQFTAWAEAYLAAEGTADRESLVERGEELARSRRKVVKDLIESNPQEALALAVSDQVRSRMPGVIQRHLEERISGRGDLRVMIACRFGQGHHADEVSREVTLGHNTYQAFVHGQRRHQVSQRNVPLQGIAIDQSMALEDAASGAPPNRPTAGDTGGGTGYDAQLPTANSSYTQGPKRLLFMRVAFPDDASEPMTESAAAALMDQVNQIYVQHSYNTTAIITDVTPLLMLPRTKSAYSSLTVMQLQDDARAAALAAGYDAASYDLDIVRNNQISGSTFAFAGQATVGGKGLILQNSLLYVAVHELGHNYGLWHANYWNAGGDSVIGPGSVVEYGNSFDTMASQNSDPATYEFSAAYKHQLQWLPSPFVQTVTNSGVHRIFAYDVPNLVGGQKYAFRVKKDFARDYWAEYRQKFAGNPWTQSGLLLNWSAFDTFVGDSLGGTVLLDTTPGTPAGKDDAPVVLGQTFSDAAAGIHITPIAKGVSGSEKWIDVQVHLGAFAGNTAPVLSLVADQTSVATGSPVSFTATASDGEGDALAYAWDFGDQTFGTNAATAGKSWSAAGEYVVRCTVSDMKGGVASRSVVITVGSPSTFRVSGQVTSGGQPLAGVRIHNGLSGAAYRGVYTDSSGNYTLANLPAGSFTLAAAKYGYSLAPSGFSNPISVGPSLTDQNWIATQGPVLGISAADASAAEAGADTGTFTLTRSGSLSSALTLKFGLSGGATYSTDYSLTPAPVSGSTFQLTMPAGVASTNLVLTPLADALTEGPESATLTLFEDPAYALGSFSEATITLTDNQAPGTPTVNVTALDDAAPESGHDTGAFRFWRSNAGSADLTVHYSVSGTAAGGVDYTALSGVALIPAGKTSVEVSFAVLDEAAVEGDETVIVTTSPDPAYAVGSLAAATVTIVDDDPVTVTVAAIDSVAGEGGNPGAFTVTRVGSLAASLVVSYTLGGSATAGADYTSPSGTVTIPAGQSTASFSIAPLNDSLVEGTETVVAVLSSSPVYNIGNPGAATLTLSDDDTPAITLAATDSGATEAGPTTGTFQFARTGSTAAPLTVRFAISGTAFLDADYGLSNTNGSGYTNSIVIPAGSSSVDLTVTPVDDAIKESNETVQVTLLDSPTAAYSVTTTTPQTVTITDNDAGGLVGVSFSTATSRGPESQFVITVTASLSSPAPSGGVAFGYSLSNGTATTPGDYVFDPPGLKVIPTGGTSSSFIVFGVNDDAIAEADETVLVTLTSPLLCVLDNANTVHTYTILDNDGSSGTVTVSAIDPSASETGANTGTLRISRSGSTATALTISAQVTGSASSPGDYSPLGNSFTIPAGSSFVDVVVTPVDDPTPEPSESVTLTLLSASGATVGDLKSATVTIADDDQGSAPPVVGIVATDGTALEPGADTGTFTVTRTGSTVAPLTVHFTTGGSAVGGVDYNAIGTSTTIPAGASSAPITITPLDDALTETSETVTVTLTVQGDYRADPNASAATVTISDAPVIVNHPPVPASPVIERYPLLGVKVSVAALLGSDPDGDPVTLQSLDATSAQGGTVSSNGAWVFYSPAAGFTNTDSFSYSVSDGRGGVSSGSVTIQIKVDSAASLNVAIVSQPDGSMRLRFDGVPGRTYAIQFAENLATPVWTTLGAMAADGFGAFVYVDTPPGGAPTRFYRAIELQLIP